MVRGGALGHEAKPLRRSLRRAEARLQVEHLAEQPRRLREERAPRSGGNEAPRRSVEERHAEALLGREEGAAHGGLREVERAAGPRGGSVGGEGEHHAEVAQLQPGLGGEFNACHASTVSPQRVGRIPPANPIYRVARSTTVRAQEGTCSPMDLYFAPLAVSTAARVVVEEVGATVRFHEVDPPTKTLRGDASAYRDVHPLMLVPALRTDTGELITEVGAVLQYLAARHPEAGLVPADLLQRAWVQQWLSFLSSELHKGLFTVLFDKNAPEAVRAYAMAKAAPRLDHLERHLQGRDVLVERFSVADALLVTILVWTKATPVDLTRYPALLAYLRRHRERPSVARALAVEVPLYQALLARSA